MMDTKKITPEILNLSLNLALEWGENWLAPIQERLIKEIPTLTLNETNDLNLLAKTVRQDINSFIYKTLDAKGVETEQLKEILSEYVKEKYSWIDQENFSRLFSQGCYYAWKDGLL